MTPADTLREAARLMRQRAEPATPGPWAEPVGSGDHGYVWSPCGHFQVALVDGNEDNNAKHIASWHPGLALAVADWLDDAADTIHEPGFIPGVTAVPALAVARAYLGEA